MQNLIETMQTVIAAYAGRRRYAHAGALTEFFGVSTGAQVGRLIKPFLDKPTKVGDETWTLVAIAAPWGGNAFAVRIERQ